MYDIAVGFRQSIEQRSSVADFNEETQAGCALLGAMEYHVIAFLQSPSEGERRKSR